MVIICSSNDGYMCLQWWLYVPPMMAICASNGGYVCLQWWLGAIQVLRNAIFLEIGPPPTPS